MKPLRDLADKLSHPDPGDWDPPRLWMGKSEGGVFVEFFGSPFEEPFQDLCAAVCAASVTPFLTALILRGPDEGANGTCHWDLEPLAEVTRDYERLKQLTIEQGRPGDHNSHIIGGGYEEDGVLGRLLRKMPALELLASPSAPDQSFFRTEARPLQVLSVNAGYDHQDFLENLAGATNLGQLRTLEYGEPTGRGSEDFERAPLAAYLALLRSSTVSPRHVVLRNPALSEPELRELQLIRPEVQLKVVRSEASWVR